MTQNQPLDPGSRLLLSLEEEIVWLEDLEQLSRSARDAALDRTGETLTPILEKKLELSARLAARSARRAEMLHAAGRQDNDLLVHALGLVERSRHPHVVEVFSRYVDAQERFGTTHRSSKEFFDVALSVVRDVKDALTKSDDNSTYQPNGQHSVDVVPLAISELT